LGGRVSRHTRNGEDQCNHPHRLAHKETECCPMFCDDFPISPDGLIFPRRRGAGVSRTSSNTCSCHWPLSFGLSSLLLDAGTVSVMLSCMSLPFYVFLVV
jgi:hypothetical protein